MISFPIKTNTIEEATKLQFRLVACIQKVFTGTEFLSNGDVGVVYGTYPSYTKKVEQVLADFFRSEDAVLVRGAGTGAIRSFLTLHTKPQQKILVHDAPIYSTTAAMMSELGLRPVSVDFNILTSPTEIPFAPEEISMAIVQHSRQKMSDSYDIEKVIQIIKQWHPGVKILVDDNYTILKAKKCGFEYGADASCFSLFKLLGKEGIGCVICDQPDAETIRKRNYSGGSKVQGFEAMECLRSLVYAPVALAIQSVQVDDIVVAVNDGCVPGAINAVRANAQSVVALVQFDQPIAKEVVERGNALGCAPYPVGAESKYEIAPMFYRMSGTFVKDNPELADCVVRINPMRAGASSIIRILNQILKDLGENA